MVTVTNEHGNEDLDTAAQYVEDQALDCHYGIDCTLVLSDEQRAEVEARFEDADSLECGNAMDDAAMSLYHVSEAQFVSAMCFKYGKDKKAAFEFWDDAYSKWQEDTYQAAQKVLTYLKKQLSCG